MKLKIFFAITTFLVLFSFSHLAGEETRVPFDLQAKLLLKILTFDRNLDKRADSAVVVGIVYKPGSEESEKARSEFSKALEKYSGKRVKGFPVSHISLKYVSRSDLAAEVKTHGVSVFYVTPGDSVYLKEIIKVARENSVLTATAVAKYVGNGISIGIGLKENKPEITINLSSTKAEACDFSSQLLKLARVIE
jgi:hypothetical protein